MQKATEQLADHSTVLEELALRDRALDAAPTHFSIVHCISETENVLIYVNRAFAESRGYRREQLLGTKASDALPVEWTPQQFREFNATLATGKEVRAEGQVKRQDGSTFWTGITMIPIQDASGALTHVVGISADITARRENERKQRELQQQLLDEMQQREQMAIELRLAQKLESVGRLAAGVAHEINTPIQFVNDSLYFLRSAFEDLNVLLDTCQRANAALTAGESTDNLLQSIVNTAAAVDVEFLKVEIPKAFERTFDGANRVASIVRAMKEFAHPDTNEQSPADINHALQTTLIVASNEYKYVAAVKTTFADIPMVNCNIGELNQVFLNLIVNAAHAIQDSDKDAIRGEITISTKVAGESVEITIGDNGCGIPQENLDKIFDPFFTTKEVGRGTGQGLSIARSIVIEKHRGDIRVNSNMGAGTQFTLCLPVSGIEARLKEAVA